MKDSTTEAPNHADICILYPCFEPGKRNKGISLPHLSASIDHPLLYPEQNIFSFPTSPVVFVAGDL